MYLQNLWMWKIYNDDSTNVDHGQRKAIVYQKSSHVSPAQGFIINIIAAQSFQIFNVLNNMIVKR